MSKRLLAFFLSFSLGFSSIFGQAGTNVHGVVLDKDSKEFVVGAILRLRDTSDNQLGYSVTDINGNFSILSNIALDSLSLYVQSMGYRTDTIILKTATFPLTVRLSQKATQLRDVIVRAPDIEQRSDTLIYNMSKYAKAQDRKLADVLKRLPGIKVEESGEIKYNGEPINKFYIDGNDFMDGRYGLATENIIPGDVASVEVYENHQPVKALEGLEFSQQAGLNIKLCEEARHKWVGLFEGGLGGSPFAYNASAFGMRIAGKWQSMETVRANNSGWNPMSQSQQFIQNRIFSGSYISDLWDDNITVGQPTYPLEESRIRDNSSFLVNTSNAWSISKEKELKFNFTYMSDKLDYRNGYETNYLDDTLPSYSEINTTDYKKQGINGMLNYTNNGKSTFLKNNLYLDATWNESRSSIEGTLSLSQRVKGDAFSAINDLQVLKRAKDRLLTVSSRNSYSYTSQELSAMKDMERLQTLSSHDLRSSSELRYGWTKKHWDIYGRTGVDANYHTIQSGLSGWQTEYRTQGHSNTFRFDVYVSPETQYKNPKWLITISTPIHWLIYSSHGVEVESNGHSSSSFFTVSPSVYARHKMSAKSDVIAQIKYDISAPDINLYMPSAIMISHREFIINYPVSGNDRLFSTQLNYRYRNPISSLFVNVMGLYKNSFSHVMQSQQYEDEDVVYSQIAKDNDANNFTVNADISKGIWHGRLTFGLSGRYSSARTTAMRNGTFFTYHINVTSMRTYMKGNLTPWCSLDYSVLYTKDKISITNSSNSQCDNIRQNIQLTLIPTNCIQFAINADSYYTKYSSASTSNLWLLDVSARRNVSKSIDLELTAKNILNEKKYMYENYGLLNKTTYQYDIVGRMIMINIQIII